MKRLLTAALILISLASCGGAKYERFTADYPDLFDSYVTVTGYASDREEFDRYSKIICDRIYRLHCLYDIYNDYDGVNNLKTINDSAGISPVEVDGDIIELLEFGVEACRESGGAVNIAMGPVLKIWHDYREESRRPEGRGELPPFPLLQAAAENMDANDIVIDKEAGTVFLKNAGMSLDVGAIAKGYAAQEAVNAAIEAGMESVLVSMGGNVAIGEPPKDGRKSWSVGLQDPEDSEKIMDVVYANHTAVVTSGDYQRFYTVGGKSYNHIIDPNTLMPAERYASVTVICGDSAVADMLSTSLFILPRGEGESLLKKYDAEAMWVHHDGSSEETVGFSAFRAG